MSERLEWSVPRSLDEIPRLLFLDLYQLVGIVLAIGIGIVAGSMLLGIVAGAALAHVYARLRSQRHPRFLLHLAYWHLPGWVVMLESTPPAYQRLYVG